MDRTATLDHAATRAVVLAGALPAAFESAVLAACVDTSRTLRPTALRAESRIGEALAEFDREDPAERLEILLAGLGCMTRRDTRSGGERRRYSVERVIVHESQRHATSRMLDAAWRQGRQALLSAEPLGASSPRNTQRLTLAQAAWRAALLAAGHRRRRHVLSVMIRDQEIAAVLVRAARLLGVTADVTRRSGCVVVTVPAGAADLLPATPPRLRLRDSALV